MTESLVGLCARKLALMTSVDSVDILSTLLPAKMTSIIIQIQNDIKQLMQLVYNHDSTSTNQFLSIEVKGDKSGASLQLPQHCFVIDLRTLKLDEEKSALAMEPFLSRLNFFDLCAKLSMDQATERVYSEMNIIEQENLLDHDPVVWCRALELSPRPAILHYDDIALSCAKSGLLRALERSLMKVQTIDTDTSLLQKCVLFSIKFGHFHIANHIRCENYSGAFYAVFPDGCIQAQFFCQIVRF